MDKQTYDKGLEIRSAVLGKAYVENSIRNADDFNKPFQELVTEYCWGACWGRDGLLAKQGMVVSPDDVQANSAKLASALTPLDPSQLK